MVIGPLRPDLEAPNGRSWGLPSSSFPTQNSIERVRRLLNERFRVMRERMEVFKRHIAAVADLVERFHARRPISRAVQEGAKRLQGVIRAFLGELLEMDVLDPITQDRHPVLRELEKH